MITLNKMIPYLSLFLAVSLGVQAGEEEGFEKPLPIPAVAANNAFACDLYSTLKEKGGNLLVSPYSISSALAMTYGGAEGKTKSQMAKVMHFPKKRDHFFRSFAYLNEQLQQRETYPLLPNPTLFHIANSLWMQKDYSLLPSYLDLAKQYFNGEIRALNFAADSQKSCDTINTWVKEETRGKISDLLSPDDVSQDTRLVLVNAVYMKGDWYYTFDPEKTTIAPFYLDADLDVSPLTVMPPSIDVPLMSNTDVYSYYKGEDFTLLELPYQFSTPSEAQLSFLILLPDEVRGVKELEQKLTADNLSGWIDHLQPTLVQVEMPKFKISDAVSLNETLEKMGMTEAFSDSADFSSLTENKDLKINTVVHKSFLTVDEKGTEAAAATGVTVNLTSLVEESVEPEYFRADRGFIYMIADMHTGTILFLGRMAQP